MPGHNIIVIGASAGGLEALVKLVQKLPEDINAAFFVVLHYPAHAPSHLPDILTRAGKIQADHPANGDPIQPGRIYVAPPDHHLMIQDSTVIIDHGPRQNSFRPSIDPLFRSAARAYGPRTIGILLSGMRDDGVAGMQEIKHRGGITIVQDPQEALFDSLPLAAIQSGIVDQVIPVEEISEFIITVTQHTDGSSGEARVVDTSEPEAGKIQHDIHHFEEEQPRESTTTVLTCPECGGILWEVNQSKLTSYRCHVGHTYSAETMLEEQSRAIEGAFWTALRALKERIFLLRRMAALSRKRGLSRTEKRYTEQADELEANYMLLQKSFLNGRLSEFSGAQTLNHPNQ